MEDFDMFKKLVHFCKEENILEAKYNDFEIKLKHEVKLEKRLGDLDLDDIPKEDENFEDVLFHSVGK